MEKETEPKPSRVGHGVCLLHVAPRGSMSAASVCSNPTGLVQKEPQGSCSSLNSFIDAVVLKRKYPHEMSSTGTGDLSMIPI
ncbi:hypothetical protein P7K49_012773, partial [Saguinus oedipus]